MSEIRRLLDDDATVGERALLRAASSDRPTDAQARERTLAALGLAAGVGGVATLAQVKGAAKAVGLVQKLASLSLFKWSVVVVSVATVATGVVLTQNAFVSPPKPAAALAVPNGIPTGAPNVGSGALPSPTLPLAPPARLSQEAPAGREGSQRDAPERGADPSGPGADPRSAGGTPSPVPATADSLAPSRGVSNPTSNAAAAPASQTALPPTAAPTASSVDPLSEQVVVLDRGRAALGAGDAAGCLRALDDFRRRFPKGALSTEATVLEVRARLASGDRAGASAVAHRFAQENPKSPYRTRILEIVAEK